MLEFWNVSTEMSRRCTQRLCENKQIRRVNMRWAGEPDWFYPYDMKRPDQVQHRLGKAWILTAWNLKTLASSGAQKLVHFKTEEKKFLPVPDLYAVTNHRIYGNMYHFGEFQVTESGNKWDKDYKTLFETFAESQAIHLTIVTTGHYEVIRRQSGDNLRGMRNVRVEYFTLNKLRELCWRIAIQLREESRKELTSNAKSS